ncbi:hypothetical protein RI367_008060 [Sorochytrium milnesiophthora]
MATAPLMTASGTALTAGTSSRSASPTSPRLGLEAQFKSAIAHDDLHVLALVPRNGDEEEDGVLVKISKDMTEADIKAAAANKLQIDQHDLSFEDTHHTSIVGDYATLTKHTLVYVNAPAFALREVTGPRPLPLVGNAHQIAGDSIAAFMEYSNIYGPVYKVRLFSREVLVCIDAEAVARIMPESEFFTKKIVGALQEVQAFSGRGLFTSDTSDPKWDKAHRLLIPGFGASSMKQYVPDMIHVSSQLINTFDQMVGQQVEISEWMTRFTFETIGQCGFGYDFGVVQSPDAPLHEFILAMSFCLNESKKRGTQLRLYKQLPTSSNYRFDSYVKLMQDTVEEVIRARQTNPVDKRDFLSFMLSARDQEGNGLDVENIRDQVITFLIAGHETTSTLLSWCLYLLSQHPEIEAKVLEEAVGVCGSNADEPITPSQVNQLQYIGQVLKETLRLYPPAAVLGKTCIKDTVLPGGYPVQRGQGVLALLPGLHRNPKYWGSNPDVFNPDNFSPENEAKRHPGAWAPFSGFERACIGMAFAMQEAKIALAMFLRKFKFTYPSGQPVAYDPVALTLKPYNLMMTIQRRDSLPQVERSHSDIPASMANPTALPTSARFPIGQLTIAYGSNMGTGEDFANQLVRSAKAFGINETRMVPLDQWEVIQPGYVAPQSPQGKNIAVIITSSYNGSPPDNAVKFDAWISAGKAPQDFGSLAYTVFGCGNKQWRTYQAFPKKVDELFDKMGAERLLPLGQGDADADIDGDFAQWHARFWTFLQEYFNISQPSTEVPSVAQSDDLSSQYSLSFLPLDSEATVQKANGQHLGTNTAVIESVRELQNVSLSHRSTMDVEITFPSTSEPLKYKTGDHLEVWPQNEERIVEEVALALGASLDAVFEIKAKPDAATSPRSLLSNIVGPCSVRNALTYFVDLQCAPPRALIKAVLEQCGHYSKEKLALLLSSGEESKELYSTFIAKHRTTADLICNVPSHNLSLFDFLRCANIIVTRRYSIASSPLVTPNKVKLCVAIVDNQVNDKRYMGLSSGLFARVKTPYQIQAAVRPTQDDFHPPTDPSVPVIMVCAGSGIAPFLGFLEERKFQGCKSKATAGGASTTHLFFGCRHQDQDYIYRKELEQYQADGVLDGLHVAFSRAADAKRYVQHLVLREAMTLWKLLSKENGMLYVCGDARGMAKDVHQTIVRIAQQMGAKSEEEAVQWVADLHQAGRYVEDVWG